MIRNNLYRAALFSAAGFLAFSSFAADRTGPARAPSVLVEKVVLQPEVDGKKFVGRLEAIEEVDLVARVSGYINSINFKEGDIVKKGDLLFELEDTTYRAKEQAAKAQGRPDQGRTGIRQDQLRPPERPVQDQRRRQKRIRRSRQTLQNHQSPAGRGRSDMA